MRPNTSSNLLAYIKAFLRLLKNQVIYYGNKRFCPVCEHSSGRFCRAGTIPRDDAMCPHCGSLERHRLLWLFMARKTDIFDGMQKSILHVAPEPCIELKLKQRFMHSCYITADLFNPKAMVRMDITDINYSDDYFDVILCNHVLEHVIDDRKAMREFHRILKNKGWAILLVPITSETTIEDPSVIDPKERFRMFGQEDHVRQYGLDYVDRLIESGFSVEITRVDDLVLNNEAVRMGLTQASGEIYYCTK